MSHVLCRTSRIALNKRGISIRRSICAFVFGISFSFLALPSATDAANTNPGVLPPSAKPHGHSYGEWSAMWWQWALSAPTPVNPLIDPTGANCAEGQSGKVWFLAGTAGGGTATRSCTVPAGTMLFFPIVNTFFAEEGTVEEMRAAAAAFIDSVVAMSVTIDGRPVENPVAYRAFSPEERG